MNENKQSVLVVDDTPENIDLLVGILRDTYRVRVAVNGEKAVKLATTSPHPDLVLLDIMMPGMDGYEVCRQLKADERTQDIPIIFISALDQTEDKVNAFQCGGVDYVTKPFQPEEVEARVATHLELRRRKRQLAESYEKLQEAETLRDNLVHMVVHDMRSPLAAMLGMVELVDMQIGETLEEEVRNDLEEVITSGNLLKEMISSLLDVSRMEAGTMPLDRSACDLRAVVAEALSSLRGLVRRCEVVFDPPAAAVMADCDPEVTRRIVSNLVANAIKFTRETGRVDIELHSLGAEIKIIVNDTGAGIPGEHHERIFEKFGQVQSEGTQKYSTGLGLTFCKLAAEAHGGRIGVESEVGRGSTFWFTLPACQMV